MSKDTSSTLTATAAPQDLTPHVLALHRAGYGLDLHPIIPPASKLTPNSKLRPELLGKVPGRAAPYNGDSAPAWFSYDWSKGPPDRADIHYSLKQGGSLGTLTRDLPFIDCDVLDSEISGAILDVVRNTLNAHASPVRTGRAPKWAAPFNREGDRFRKLVLKLERNSESVGMIELLGDGSQIVIAGQHPSGADYSWRASDGAVGGLEILAATPRAALPTISQAIVIDRLLPALIEKLAPLQVTVTVQGGSSGAKADPTGTDQAALLAPSIERLAEVIAATPNEADHEAYVTMGRAIRGAAGEENAVEGLAIYEEWAGRGTDGTGGSHPPAQVWDSLRPPHGLGWSYILRKSQGFINTAPDCFSADPDSVAPTGTEIPAHIADYNSRYALIRRMASTVLHTPASGPEFLPIDHWRVLTTTDRVEGKPASQLWLSHPDRRVFRQVTMDPASPPYSAIPVPGDVPDFNIWPGFAVQPSSDGSCDLFLAHLRDVVCTGNEQLYQWVLQWLAAMVQSPERLAGTALVLRGPQGSGKSYVGEVMGHLLGTGLYSKVSKPEELTGRFNSHHQGKLLLQVEEGFFAGNRAAVGALKHMVTSDRVRIEGKFRDSYEIPNFCRLLITSNEDWVIPAGESERRFTVVDVADFAANEWDYHAALRAQMANGGYANLLHVLLGTALDWKLLSRPINTVALRDQQLASMEADARWLFDILHVGDFPDGRIEADLLYRQYAQFLRDHSAGRRADREAMGKLLKRVGARQVRVRQGAGRTRVYAFPPLAECRAAVAVGLALPPEWDGPTSWPTEASVLEEVLS